MNNSNLLQLRATMRLIAAASSVVIAMGAGSAFASVNVDSSISDTGVDSVQDNDTNVDQDVDVTVDNTSDVVEVVAFTGNSGDNQIARNTNAGDVETGEIGADISLENELNAGAGVDGGMFDNMDVSADFDIADTGDSSENTNTLNVNDDFDLDVTNDANVDTNVSLNLNTGRNVIERNTNVNDSKTGAIDVDLSTDNRVNTGASSVDLGGLGGGDVDVDGAISDTGDSSENTNTVNVDRNVDIDVTNTANIDTDVRVNANTGRNITRRNTNADGAATGEINFSYNGSNQAN